MLQVAHRIERVLKGAGDVLLYILCAGTAIGGHHHDSVGLYIRIEVYRQFVE